MLTGGSETFQDKQTFFNHEIRQLHSRHKHDRLAIKIDRFRFFQSVSVLQTTLTLIISLATKHILCADLGSITWSSNSLQLQLLLKGTIKLQLLITFYSNVIDYNY